MKPFSVVLKYADLNGESYENQVELDMKQFKGLTWQSASVAWRQMDALEKINRQTENLVSLSSYAGIVAKYVLAKWRFEHRHLGTIENLPKEYLDRHDHEDDTVSA